MLVRMLRFGLCAVMTAAVAGGSQADAATLTLDTGKSVVIDQGATAGFTFSVTNSDAGDITDFLGWVIGFQVIPAGGNTGSLTIGSLQAATTDPMPVGDPDISQPTQSLLNNSINGTTVFNSMSILSTTELGTLISGTTYNLGTLSFTASGDAEGTWNVYAVQENPQFQKTYWFDSTATEIQFGNLAFGQGSVGLLVGTVIAVPEPSAWWLLASGSSAGLLAWRRRRLARVSERVGAPIAA